MEFIKMHGLGNDYIFIDGDCDKMRAFDVKGLSNLSRCMSDRRYGVGGDGIVIYGKINETTYNMRIFNSDGSEAEICGNALRCLAKLLVENKKIKRGKCVNNFGDGSDFDGICGNTPMSKKFVDMTIVTKAGDRHCRAYLMEQRPNVVEFVLVNMQSPNNLAKMKNEIEENKLGKCLNVAEKEYKYYFINVGNPHAVIFTDREIKDEEFYLVAPLIEKYPAFEGGINVEFVTILDDGRVKMRVWERGSGETAACGSGACAVAVACAIVKQMKNPIRVECEGGELIICFKEVIYMLGEAMTVFRGEML